MPKLSAAHNSLSDAATLELAPTADGNIAPTSTIVIPSTLVKSQSSPTSTLPGGKKNSASSLKMDSVSIVLATLVPLFVSGFLDDVFREFQRHNWDGM